MKVKAFGNRILGKMLSPPGLYKKSKSGLLIADKDMDATGIKPRWFEIYSVGEEVDFCKEGDSIIEELGLVLGRLDKRNKTGIFLPTTQGKKAYNDGVRDYFLFEDDPKIKQLNLQKGGKARAERSDK